MGEKCTDHDPEIQAKSRIEGCCVEDFCAGGDCVHLRKYLKVAPREQAAVCGVGVDEELIWGRECTWDEECCSGKCGEGGCLPANPGFCGV